MLDRLQKTPLSAAQNQFTAYLVAAIRNYKAVYLKRRQKRLAVEIPLDQVDDVPAARSEPDYLRGLPPLQQLGNESLFHALRKLKSRDRYIFLARALEGTSFAQIADTLEMSYGAVAMSYHRTVARLKEAILGEGNHGE